MNIAILGLGTIGSGVYKLLKNREDICVKRILDLKCWTDNMTTDINDIVNDESIETVVETMGGIHPAREYALKCIQAGKNYVSANKLLISKCAQELKSAAEENDVSLLFGAACGGGIPYLKSLSESRDIDRITAVGGILNGTTNYILDNVFSNGISYDDALAEAQRLGFAERDPSSDINGLDTARKLILSCACAFGTLLNEEDMPIYGITNLSNADVAYAKENHCVIRLTAKAVKEENGETEAYVVPEMIPEGSVEAGIRQNVNYAYFEGKNIGRFGFTGQGAGKMPTAANIIRDVCSGSRTMLPAALYESQIKPVSMHAFYVRVPKAFGEEFNAVAEKIDILGEYIQVITKPVTFEELRALLKDIDDKFIMLMR